ncbi:MAG: 2-oxoacid:acceptor oxidoreductase subunit alpha [Candidatus Omnitrophica bacterium]|nr:2-oxoacid:acceptor oxidoreductase subunit alpha [Candidatus Omnitrophota bacterium]
MNSFSILIGGKAGFGIDKSGSIIASLAAQLGYRLYVYRDYPSLIRGGHTFSIIRASAKRIAAHEKRVDVILALNQDTVNLHKERLKENSIIIYDSDTVKAEGVNAQLVAIPLGKIMKEENAPEIMRNTCIIGGLARVIGIGWDVLDSVLRKEITKEIDLNLKVARRGYDESKESFKIEPLNQNRLPLFTGNEAIGLGLIKGGLKTYIAYPMTPSSPLLHFLANLADTFSLKVIHPENEIAVILMALGFAYAGEKTAIGTSGGGFCLMTEGLSFSAMAELPITIMVSQRPGPSTGLPTYSSQTELHFVLNAGQGEFPRFIVAPGDPEEAYFWSRVALNISWKYQIPSFILSDKNLGEGTYSFDMSLVKELKEEAPLLWDRKAPYKRYLRTETGVSPLTFPSDKDAIIKANSYEHDEYGITTEDPIETTKMHDKRLRKEIYVSEELEHYETVKVHGKRDAATALLCWGSNKGVSVEVAEILGLKVIQPIALSPFPIKQFKDALRGVKKLIAVENNATGQLVRLVSSFGLKVDKKILKYDGRPFTLDELQEAL